MNDDCGDEQSRYEREFVPIPRYDVHLKAICYHRFCCLLLLVIAIILFMAGISIMSSESRKLSTKLLLGFFLLCSGIVLAGIACAVGPRGQLQSVNGPMEPEGVQSLTEANQSNSKKLINDQSTLIYRKIGPSTILIEWELQRDAAVTEGFEVLYTDNSSLPKEMWQQVVVSARCSKTVLSGLIEGQDYFVEIHPRTATGCLNGSGVHRIFNGSGSSDIVHWIWGVQDYFKDVLKILP